MDEIFISIYFQKTYFRLTSAPQQRRILNLMKQLHDNKIN